MLPSLNDIFIAGGRHPTARQFQKWKLANKNSNQIIFLYEQDTSS
jgi:hypothetical protein